MPVVIVTGDDVALAVTLKKDAATFTIDPGATVQAAIVNQDRSAILVGPVTLSNAAAGADWANSLVVVEFSSTDTGAILVFEPALLEIEVDDGGKLTWFANVETVKGSI